MLWLLWIVLDKFTKSKPITFKLYVFAFVVITLNKCAKMATMLLNRLQQEAKGAA